MVEDEKNTGISSKSRACALPADGTWRVAGHWKWLPRDPRARSEMCGSGGCGNSIEHDRRPCEKSGRRPARVLNVAAKLRRVRFLRRTTGAASWIVQSTTQFFVGGERRRRCSPMRGKRNLMIGRLGRNGQSRSDGYCGPRRFTWPEHVGDGHRRWVTREVRMTSVLCSGIAGACEQRTSITL